MKSQFIKLMLPALLTGIIVACSSGGNLAGIGGSGYISTGTVTGFGSVFVNGVEFDTDATVFEVEDNDGSQDDLRIGMVVQVAGSINADGVTGTATRIRYGDQLEGPIAPIEGSLIIEPNADVTEKRFRVMGTNVIVDATDTIFEGSGFNFDSIALDNAVEISGYYDQNDVLRATYIERTATVFDPASAVEIEGTISALSGTSFTIRNVNVDASGANLSDLPNGLQNALYVEVKGTYNSANNTITASEVEAEDIEYSDDGSEVSIEGYITRYVSRSDFDINGYRINASQASLEPASLVLEVGIKVEAEGTVSNGVLNATEVEAQGGDAQIHADVGDVNASAGTFTVIMPPANNPVAVTVTSATTLEDDEQEIEPFSLVNLNNGDYVEVTGFETDTSDVTASKVKRRVPEDYILQGYAMAATGNAAAGGDITVLGVIMEFSSSTDFENSNDQDMTADQINALLSTINSTPTLLKIKDVDGDGVAEEIDQE